MGASKIESRRSEASLLNCLRYVMLRVTAITIAAASQSRQSPAERKVNIGEMINVVTFNAIH